MNEMIYGIHTVEALLRKEKERFQEVLVLKGRKDKRLLPLIQSIEDYGLVIKLVSRQYLDKKSEGAVHQGIIAYVKSRKKYQENDLPRLISPLINPFLLILDSLTDPRNLGACIRSADAAGVDAVIIPQKRSAKLNATANKVSCGAAENIPLIQVRNLARNMQFLQEKDIRIIGTSGKASLTLYETKMTGPIALVIGSEGNGIRCLTRKYCNETVCIPMIGKTTSLNVSVATGIFLFEAVRQRKIKNILSYDMKEKKNTNNIS